MAETVRASGKCAAFMVVSRAVRVARAAVDRGLDLTGATFVAAGEPASPARVSAIRRSGAALMTTYGQVEAGRIGMGCCEADDASDVHVLSDVCSVVMSSRRLPPLVEPRAALDLTVLVPTAPKVILNTGLDDCAILETRTCGCALGRLGLTTHLRSIGSYGKFTSEGVTVLESEIAHIVEAVLPARFGGTAIDYQLLEEEDETGRARVTLVVNPALPMPADAELIRAVLEGLGRESLGAEAARQVWARTGSLTVRRARPVVTARGKMNAVYRVRT
jgi:hypothetical protein